MRSRNQRGGGFTLIELLVVIAIIGLLASLLLPALARGKSTVHSSTCKNRLKQIVLSLQLYCEDNSSFFPFLFMSANDDPDQKNPQYWFESIRPYYRLHWTNRAFHCASYTHPIYGIENGHTRGSYAYNGWGVYPSWDSKLGLGSYSVAGNRHPAVREAQVRAPAMMYAVADARLVANQFGIAGVVGMPVMWNERGYPEAAENGRARHGKSYNVAFCDGHVESVRRIHLTNSIATARFFNIDNEPHPEIQNLISQ